MVEVLVGELVVTKERKQVKTLHEAEIDKDVQNVNKGDVHCIRCNKDFPSTAQLKKHVQIYHKNVYSHICNICDKGFHSMEGLREHQKVHKGSLFKCEKCTKTFTMARAKKRHLHDIHGKKLISNVNTVDMYPTHIVLCTYT